MEAEAGPAGHVLSRGAVAASIEQQVRDLSADGCSEFNSTDSYHHLTDLVRADASGYVGEEMAKHATALAVALQRHVGGSNDEHLRIAALRLLGYCLHHSGIVRAIEEAALLAVIDVLLHNLTSAASGLLDKTTCNLCIWVFAVQNMPAAVVAKKLRRIVEGIVSAQKADYKSATVETESLNVLDKLFESHAEGMANTSWTSLIFRCLMSPGINSRGEKVCERALGMLRTYAEHLGILDVDHVTLLLGPFRVMYAAGKPIFVLETWCLLVMLLGNRLHSRRSRAVELLNGLLKIVDSAFKSSRSHVRLAAFRAWSALIDNFGSDPAILSDPKRLRLIMQPLLLVKTRDSAELAAKADVWWHLCQKLKGRLGDNFAKVCVPLLGLFFKSSDGAVAVLRAADPDGASSRVRGFEVLAQLLQTTTLPTPNAAALAPLDVLLPSGGQWVLDHLDLILAILQAGFARTTQLGLEPAMISQAFFAVLHRLDASQSGSPTDALKISAVKATFQSVLAVLRASDAVVLPEWKLQLIDDTTRLFGARLAVIGNFPADSAPAAGSKAAVVLYTPLELLMQSLVRPSMWPLFSTRREGLTGAALGIVCTAFQTFAPLQQLDPVIKQFEAAVSNRLSLLTDSDDTEPNGAQGLQSEQQSAVDAVHIWSAMADCVLEHLTAIRTGTMVKQAFRYNAKGIPALLSIPVFYLLGRELPAASAAELSAGWVRLHREHGAQCALHHIPNSPEVLASQMCKAVPEALLARSPATLELLAAFTASLLGCDADSGPASTVVLTERCLRACLAFLRRPPATGTGADAGNGQGLDTACGLLLLSVGERLERLPAPRSARSWLPMLAAAIPEFLKLAAANPSLLSARTTNGVTTLFMHLCAATLRCYDGDFGDPALGLFAPMLEAAFCHRIGDIANKAAQFWQLSFAKEAWLNLPPSFAKLVSGLKRRGALSIHVPGLAPEADVAEEKESPAAPRRRPPSSPHRDAQVEDLGLPGSQALLSPPRLRGSFLGRAVPASKDTNKGKAPRKRRRKQLPLPSPSPRAKTAPDAAYTHIQTKQSASPLSEHQKERRAEHRDTMRAVTLYSDAEPTLEDDAEVDGGVSDPSVLVATLPTSPLTDDNHTPTRHGKRRRVQTPRSILRTDGAEASGNRVVFDFGLNTERIFIKEPRAVSPQHRTAHKSPTAPSPRRGSGSGSSSPHVGSRAGGGRRKPLWRPTVVQSPKSSPKASPSKGRRPVKRCLEPAMTTLGPHAAQDWRPAKASRLGAQPKQQQQQRRPGEEAGPAVAARGGSGMFFPRLRNCHEPLGPIMAQLSTGKQGMRIFCASKKLKLVSDLCALSHAEASRLPIPDAADTLTRILEAYRPQRRKVKNGRATDQFFDSLRESQSGGSGSSSSSQETALV